MLYSQFSGSFERNKSIQGLVLESDKDVALCY